MRINLHIERMALEGFELAPWQKQQLHEAVHTELARQLAANTEFRPSQGSARARIDGGAFPAPDRDDPARLGGRIARAVSAIVTAT